MGEEVNWWAILLATASSMVLGALWYARPVFGDVWMKASGVDEKHMRRGMLVPMLLTLLMSLLTAFTLAHVSFLSNHYFRDSFFVDAVQTAFLMWLGFEVTTLVTHYSFERRPVKLLWLNIGNRFVTVIAMGMIIGWLHP